jgi:hypothetical protein
MRRLDDEKRPGPYTPGARIATTTQQIVTDTSARVDVLAGIVAAAILGDPRWRLDDEALLWAFGEALERTCADLKQLAQELAG